MNEAFRLSRIRAPRGTATAMILLAVFFLLFGLWISVMAPEQAAAAPRYLDRAPVVVNWLVDTLGDLTT
jgi:hypothetical protein